MVDYSKIKYHTLRKMCKELDLPTKGKKVDLVNRLKKKDADDAAAAEASPVSAEASPVTTDSPDDDADPISPFNSFNNLDIGNSPSRQYRDALALRCMRNENMIADLQVGHNDLKVRVEKNAENTGRQIARVHRSQNNLEVRVEKNAENSGRQIARLNHEVNELKRSAAKESAKSARRDRDVEELKTMVKALNFDKE